MHNADLSLSGCPPWMANDVRSGIRGPRVIHLSPGTKLFRFASSAKEPHLRPAGAWWIGQAAFNLVMRDAVQSKSEMGLGWSGRRALAIRKNWSPVDVLVEARVQESIKLFAGRGTTQFRESLPNGMFITWEGWPEVEQWYLPFICDPNGMTPLGKAAISVYRSTPIESYQLL